jgi:hypothetical protein
MTESSVQDIASKITWHLSLWFLFVMQP